VLQLSHSQFSQLHLLQSTQVEQFSHVQFSHAHLSQSLYMVIILFSHNGYDLLRDSTTTYYKRRYRISLIEVFRLNVVLASRKVKV
jgi:hypothetical protein